MPPAEIWIDGLVQSSIYITMAFGMVLVFSILGILNWTHGQYYMLGAVLVYYGVTLLGIPFPVSMLIAGVIIAALGMVIKKVIIDRVSGGLYIGVVTLALIFFIEGATSMIFGLQDKGMADVMPGIVDFGTFSISYQKILVVGFAIVVMSAMYVVLNRTKIGLAIRAVAQEPLAASLYGVRIDRVSLIVTGIGWALAAWAGCIMAPMYSINPFIGRAPMLFSLLAIVIGGLGSLSGAIIGGLILGFLNSVISYYISFYSEAVLFLLIIVLLLVRPQGLFGVIVK